MKANIFELDAEINKIAEAFDKLEEAGTEQEFLDSVEVYFGNLLDDRDRKLDAYADLVAHYKNLSELRKKESKRLAELAQSDENRADRLKGRLKQYLDFAEITRIDTPYHRISVCGNGGLTPLIVDEDLDLNKIHGSYVLIKRELNTAEVRASLTAGDDVPFARLGDRGSHVRIA